MRYTIKITIIVHYIRMVVSIFLVCYNEQYLLPHTVAHYRRYIPNCNITVYDNYSTDNSVEIAKSLGCTVVPWNTNNITDEHKLRDLKNSCWKSVPSGWIIMADMDEWLCITKEDLQKELDKGTTVITVKGYNMIGESQKEDISDIDLHSIIKGVRNTNEDKKLCFLREKIVDINYNCGAHNSNPAGEVRYSKTVYTNKHMCCPGLQFLIERMIARYNRSIEMRKIHMDTHYTDNVTKITADYNKSLSISREVPTHPSS